MKDDNGSHLLTTFSIITCIASRVAGAESLTNAAEEEKEKEFIKEPTTAASGVSDNKQHNGPADDEQSVRRCKLDPGLKAPLV